MEKESSYADCGVSSLLPQIILSLDYAISIFNSFNQLFHDSFLSKCSPQFIQKLQIHFQRHRRKPNDEDFLFDSRNFSYFIPSSSSLSHKELCTIIPFKIQPKMKFRHPRNRTVRPRVLDGSLSKNQKAFRQVGFSH